MPHIDHENSTATIPCSSVGRTTSISGSPMTSDDRIERLEKALAKATEKIAVLEFQLVHYDVVERMAFMSYARTHPDANRDLVRISHIINQRKDKPSSP